ncbi:DUF6468 domain-containing protein [Caulobacter hibisci]|uniref:Flagellar positioning protein PflI n=1 Tax=Caulobacter hibisci TaxID=2035993 RepID=A0ABS0T4S3_9CAUL|nr:DUF6468 domain-containing protein [Caulobacter hibisci]MBI1686085.1 flagellar positioning protein PflI [Caulobacter hibisci]
MSLIAVALQVFLAVLLMVALVFGWRLERKLKALRDAQAGFGKAVADLDNAAQRAEQGLADLRAATDEASEYLADRIEKAKFLAAQLDDRMTRAASAPRVESRAEPRPEPRQELGQRQARDPRDFVASQASEPPPEPTSANGRRLSAQDFEAMLEREARARSAPPATSRPATSGNSSHNPSPIPSRETARSRARVDDDLFDGPDPASRPGSPFRDRR